jgi:hypothetical protein
MIVKNKNISIESCIVCQLDEHADCYHLYRYKLVSRYFRKCCLKKQSINYPYYFVVPVIYLGMSHIHVFYITKALMNFLNFLIYKIILNLFMKIKLILVMD